MWCMHARDGGLNGRPGLDARCVAFRAYVLLSAHISVRAHFIYIHRQRAPIPHIICGGPCVVGIFQLADEL